MPFLTELRRFDSPQMFVEPVREYLQVRLHAGPAMAFAFAHYELDRSVRLFAALHKNLRLIEFPGAVFPPEVGVITRCFLRFRG